MGSIGLFDDYQKLGLGTHLFNRMVSELKKLGMKKMTLNATPTGYTPYSPDYQVRIDVLVQWYKRRGAKIVEVVPHQNGVTSYVEMAVDL